MGLVSVTMFSDAACPWAYSVSPSLRVLEWRYGEQLEWRLVLIGLTEQASQYVERGYTPLRVSTTRRLALPTSGIRRKRTAAGSAAELQAKTAQTDGPVRFTAPSLVFERNGQRLIAGGFQPLEAYDVLVANLHPGLERRPAPGSPAPLLDRFPDGLTTQEVAALLVKGNEPADRHAAENALLELAAAGHARRQ